MSPAITRRSQSGVFFAACMVAIAIVVHLVAEYAGIGEREFSHTMELRHLYLIPTGLGAVATALSALRLFAPARLRREHLAALLAGLPFGGGGRGFVGLCFGVQIVLFAGSQAIEGCPIADGDAVAAGALALLLSTGAAFAIGALPRRVAKLLRATYLSRLLDHTHAARPHELERVLRAAKTTPFLRIALAVIGNRPPPVIEQGL